MRLNNCTYYTLSILIYAISLGILVLNFDIDCSHVKKDGYENNFYTFRNSYPVIDQLCIFFESIAIPLTVYIMPGCILLNASKTHQIR
jgi:hypothetical protein